MTPDDGPSATYLDEMAVLRHTYGTGVAAGDRDPGVPLADGPAVFVASGGSLSAARLGADLHLERSGWPALVMTPTAFLHSRIRTRSVVVVSDSLGHPDARLAIRAGEERVGSSSVLVVTNRTDAEARAIGVRGSILTCPRPGHDGWIATNSVLSFALGFISLYDTMGLAPSFDDLAESSLGADLCLRAGLAPTGKQLMVLWGHRLESAAIDLDARLMESGLGLTAVGDLRSLAHGRHVGIDRAASDWSIVLLSDAESEDLAAQTAAAIPGSIDVRRWTSEQPWPWSAVDLLLASFGLLALRSRQAEVDPAHPAVPAWGAALFQLAAPVPDGQDVSVDG